MKFIVTIKFLMKFVANTFTAHPSNGRSSTAEPFHWTQNSSNYPISYPWRLVKSLEQAEVERIQFDVMYGNFVPKLTFGPDLIAIWRKYSTVQFKIQFMASRYNCESIIDEWTEATEVPNWEPDVIISNVEGNNNLHHALTNICE